MCDDVVTSPSGVLGICAGVLRDVTVLAFGSEAAVGIGISDLPLFRRTCTRVSVVCAVQTGHAACNRTCWISSSESLAPSWPDENDPRCTPPDQFAWSAAAELREVFVHDSGLPEQSTAVLADLAETPAERRTVTDGWLHRH